MMIDKKLLTAVALAAAALTSSGPVFAQATMPASGAAASSGSTPSKADRQFVTEAAKGGMAEVALGQLAQQKGNSDAVKQFGAKMVEDHTKANDELKQLATSKGIALPTSPSSDSMAKKLGSMNGSGFDKAYMAQMLTDHKKTVALFQKEARSGSDPDLKAFASKTLPTLQEHLKMVESSHRAGVADKGAVMKH